MHGVLVAGHLKWFYKKIDLKANGSEPESGNHFKKPASALKKFKILNAKYMLGRALTLNSHLSTNCALLT